mgnify:FL=1
MKNSISIEPELLYKYRSLENLERFLDIVIDNKLYGALYKEMNDPMEGYFQYSSDVDKSVLTGIWEGKNKRYICSLSKKSNIGLMWTHYANENKGCCIEVEVTSKTWERLDVEYKKTITNLSENTTIEDILKVKASMWEYEQEVRYLSPVIANKKKSNPQLTVRIHRIIFCYKVKIKKYNRFKRIISALNPNIKVERMDVKNLDYGYRM